MREQSKFDWFIKWLYFHCDWTKFDKLKLILVLMPLGSEARKRGPFGSYIPTCCSKTWLKRNVFLSQNLHPWNTEFVNSGALVGGLIFRRSLAWDGIFQPACCCLAHSDQADWTWRSLLKIGGLCFGKKEIKTEFARGPGRGDTCYLPNLDETLPDWRDYQTTLKDKVGRLCDFSRES